MTDAEPCSAKADAERESSILPMEAYPAASGYLLTAKTAIRKSPQIATSADVTWFLMGEPKQNAVERDRPEGHRERIIGRAANTTGAPEHINRSEPSKACRAFSHAGSRADA